MEENTAPHFHILWIIGEISRMDWEAFASREEAEASANKLKSASETYVIDEFNGSCERCVTFRLEHL